MALKNNFLKLRLKLGYKHSKDFAAYLGINKDQYFRYENNVVEPGIETYYRAFLKIKELDPSIHFEDLLITNKARGPLFFYLKMTI